MLVFSNLGSTPQNSHRANTQQNTSTNVNRITETELGLKVLKNLVNSFAMNVFAYLIHPKTVINVGYFYFGAWHWTGFLFAAIFSWFNFCLSISLAVYVTLFAAYTSDSIETLQFMRYN